MNILEELFSSHKRKMVDDELRRLIASNVTSHSLRENLSYHFFPNSLKTGPSLSHNKRLRSYLCLLFAEEKGYAASDVLPLAVTVELLHNSTLIVDDVQDSGVSRHDQPALWKKVGIAQAMNVAFYLATVAQAYYQMHRTSIGLYDYSEEIYSFFDKIISGQQEDIIHTTSFLNIDSYERLVDGKTGALIALSCKMGSCPFTNNHKHVKIIEKFSILLARLHQLQDDLEDLITINNKTNSVIVKETNIIKCFSNETRDNYSTINIQQIQENRDAVISYQSKTILQLNETIDLLYAEKIVVSPIIRELVAHLINRNNNIVDNVMGGGF